MSPRSRFTVLIAALAFVGSAVPAAAFGPGTTFLTGGLDLPAGAIAGGQSGAAFGAPQRGSVSADGRYVAFVSDADTLDSAASPDATNVYRKDRLTGDVVLVSRGDGVAGAAAAVSSELPSISADGTRVAFRTAAPLVPADLDGGATDVYVRDVPAGTTTLASVGNAGRQVSTSVGDFDLSGNGRYVAFQTDASLDAVNDPATASDVYVRDLLTGTSTLASSPDGSLAAGNAASYTPSISADGRWVAFVSDATNLVAGYAAGGAGRQLFARDRTLNRTFLVSASASSATRGSNGQTDEPDVAGAPTTNPTIAYASNATNVASGGVDGSAVSSVYVRTRSSTPSVLISRADVGAGDANADSRAHTPSISDDGLQVAFASDATNLGAGADYYGVYIHTITDTSTGRGRTLLASAHNAYAVQPAFAGDGGFLTWVEVGATADSDPDLYGVFGRDFNAATLALGAVELVSRPSGTAPFLSTWISVGTPDTGKRVVSADGRYIVFMAYSSRLAGAGAGVPGATQVYRRDLRTGAIELVSRATGSNGAPADVYSYQPSISADGTRVAFLTGAHLDPAHTGLTFQAYVRDLTAGTTTLVSRADGAAGAASNEDAFYPAISPDGSRVAFATTATNMGVPGTDQHVYVRDLAAGATLLVDRANGAAGAPGDDNAELPSLSRDGRWVAFASQAGNLDADDPDRSSDVFLRDTVGGTTTLLSRRSGLAGQHAAALSYDPSISADASVVAFQASDETLAPEAGPWGGKTQIVARTVATGANVLVSRAPGGTPANDHAVHASVSGDGGAIAFESAATNLLAGIGGPAHAGVFARTMATGALSGPPAFGLLGTEFQDRAQYPAISDDGQCLAFDALGHNAATGTAGDGYTTYMYVVSGACPKPEPVVVPPPMRRVARPALSRVALSHRRFRVGRRATAKSAATRRRARRAPVGTTFRFTLNARANVAIAFERQAPGRLVGRFCRRPAPRLRRHLRCVRFVRVGRISRGGLSAGTNRIAFSGRIGRKALKPGVYRARVRASNAGGASAWVRLGFRVVK